MSSWGLMEVQLSFPYLHRPTCKPRLERTDGTRSSEFVMTPTIQAESPFDSAFFCRRVLKNGRTSGYKVYPAAELKRVKRSGTRSGRLCSELKGRKVARMIYIWSKNLENLHPSKQSFNNESTSRRRHGHNKTVRFDETNDRSISLGRCCQDEELNLPGVGLNR